MLRNSLLGLSLLGLAVLAPTCAPVADPDTDTLTIGAYSVAREALHDGLLPAFAARWEGQHPGRHLRFEESYNGSGAQTRSIASGFDADVAVLSLEDDVEQLVKAGVVNVGWNSGPARGMVTRSLVVIAHRPGNPKGIADWRDLTRPGVAVLYPDPKTSGGARWNINAIYGAGLLSRQPDDPQEARGLLAAVQANVVNMDSSGRQSMATFGRGTGDAVVTYENEILLQSKMNGQAVPYVIPPATLLIEGPAAVVDASVDRHGNRALAEAFLAFMRSPEGQAILVDYGFRPLDPMLDADTGRAPFPPKLFTMKDVGGWTKAKEEIYAPGGVWDSIFTRKAGAKPGGAGR